MSQQFPHGFLWGAATSSFQIEGGANADGKGESIWDEFCRRPGKIADGSSGLMACDHYNRLDTDLALIEDLGFSAYRFSIAWPRVFPTGSGALNRPGLDFYDRLVEGLLERDIVPMPTLYHWDLPLTLGERGGWLSRDTSKFFADYAHAISDYFGDRIPAWTTLNEPFVAAHHGYRTGDHAPGHRSMTEALDASHNLMLAHGLGTQAIRAASAAEVGIVLNFTEIVAETDSAEDAAEAERMHDINNRWYADAITGRGYPATTAEFFAWPRTDQIQDGDMATIAQPLDLLGVNHYSRELVSAVKDRVPAPRLPVTEMGWEIVPEALGRLLRHLNDRYEFPKIFITENGAAMPDTKRSDTGQVDDQDRISYLKAHIAEVGDAISDGVPVEGYFAWSLLDNFEWAHGYEKRFGIVEVDYETLDRRPKASADWYRDFIAKQ